MNDFIKSLVTDRGFIFAFWTVLAQRRSRGENVTQLDVFEELNDLYREEFGEDRFSSFDAFRKKRDRRKDI